MVEEDPESEIIHRDFDTDAGDPAIQVVEAVAEIEERDTTDLASMYGCVDGVLDHVFSNPPAPEAQLMVEFSYETYRITVEQDGSATFVKTE